MSECPFQYKSIANGGEGIYKDRGSKFYGYLRPVNSIEEIEEALSEIAGEHPKARHVCYAYRLGIDGEPFRINDDGEPSGSAGRPIFNELLSADCSDIIGVVVRYFGGTKLGIPGLIKAYKGAIKEAFLNVDFKIITLTRKVRINYKIEDTGRVYEIIKSHKYPILEQIYEPSPILIVDVPLNELGKVRSSIIADYFKYDISDITSDFHSDKIEVEVL